MHPKNNTQLLALTALAKELKVEFETSPYSKDFVAKVKQSKKEVDSGKFTVLDSQKSMWESLK